MLTFAARIDQSKHIKPRERPFCTHCNKHGHTVDKCYKLHGYPPGYNVKNRGAKPNSVNMASVNMASESTSGSNDSIHNLLQNLNSHQYQQLASMFSGSNNASQPNSIPASNTPMEPNNITCCVTGPSSGNCFFNSPKIPTYKWIIDSGAS